MALAAAPCRSWRLNCPGPPTLSGLDKESLSVLPDDALDAAVTGRVVDQLSVLDAFPPTTTRSPVTPMFVPPPSVAVVAGIDVPRSIPSPDVCVCIIGGIDRLTVRGGFAGLAWDVECTSDVLTTLGMWVSEFVVAQPSPDVVAVPVVWA